MNEHLKQFKTYVDGLAINQDTIKFWYDFLFKDCFPYISLFVSLRYRIWDLRTGSLKELIAVYAAFDRQFYKSLIPNHLNNLDLFPYILNMTLTKRLVWCGS